MKPTPRFWNRIAKKYAAKPVSDEAAYQHKLQLTQKYLKPDMDVLEVGCGTGTTALIHAPSVRSIVATDFSEQMIEIAQKKMLEQQISNVQFKCEAFEELSQHSKQYDLIMAHSILHLLPDLEGALNLLFKQLKPGGYLVSSTACINDMIWFFRYIAPVAYNLRLIPFVNCFSEQEFINKLQQTGFEVELKWQANRKAALFLICRKPEKL